MKFRPMLYDELEAEDILEKLAAENIITSQDMETVMKCKHQEDKIDHLLSYLQTAGPHSYRVLQKVLTGKYQHVLKVIEEGL